MLFARIDLYLLLGVAVVVAAAFVVRSIAG
jgi:hypothetical protein